LTVRSPQGKNIYMYLNGKGIAIHRCYGVSLALCRR
jgi:hypothetical protein